MANCFSMGTVRGSVLPLLLLFLLLPPLQVLSQDAFDLSDALSDDDSKPASPTPKDKKAGGGATGGDFDLSDLFKDTTTAKPKSKPDPKVPKSTTAPAKPKPKPAGDDLSLADALDPINDINRKDKDKGQGGTFSDDDLLDVSKDKNYNPDKGKGRPSYDDSDHINQRDDNSDTTTEVGTIAGIVSAVAMALVGAISSYISYQKKKLCFGIQQSLNANMEKAENPDAVVATEPQVQQSLLEPANTEPRTEENAV